MHLSQRRTQGAIAAALISAVALVAIPQRIPTPEEAAADRAAFVERAGRQELAAAIDRYRADHGALPGRIHGGALADGLDPALLARQLTMATDVAGRVAPASEPAFPYGPYLAGVPTNTTTGLTTVRFAEADDPADGRAGWIVDPTTGQVRPDTPAEARR